MDHHWKREHDEQKGKPYTATEAAADREAGIARIVSGAPPMYPQPKPGETVSVGVEPLVSNERLAQLAWDIYREVEPDAWPDGLTDIENTIRQAIREAGEAAAKVCDDVAESAGRHEGRAADVAADEIRKRL